MMSCNEAEGGHYPSIQMPAISCGLLKDANDLAKSNKAVRSGPARRFPSVKKTGRATGREGQLARWRLSQQVQYG